MGGFGIGKAAVANGGACLGNSAMCGSASSVALGNIAQATGLGGMAIGMQSTCSANNSLAIGINANNSAVGGMAFGRNCLNSGGNGISIGTSANCSITSGICIGESSTASVAGAIALGTFAQNAITNSLLVAASANIRSTATTCDLGTTANPFQTLFLNNRVDSAASLNLGTTNATVVNIGSLNTSTILLGKGYIKSTRPIMSGLFSMITDTSVSNTVTETNIIGAGVGTLASPPNSIAAGNAFRIHTSGSVTIAAGTQVLTIRLYAGPGSSLIVSTYTITLASLTGTPPPYNL